MSRWFSVLLIAMLLFGVALRVGTLGTKLFWLDETFTQLRVAGYTAAELQTEFFDARPHPVAVLRHRLDVGSDATPGALIRSLKLEDVQHPPLFYLLDQSLIREFGNTIASWRLAALLSGLLAIAAAFWFGRELLGTESGLLTAALVAVSPFCVLYSQQAREYGLWVTLTLASSAALLRALKDSRPRWWLLYALLTLAGWYTAILFAVILAVHVLLVFLDARVSLRSRLAFVAALGGGAILFVPWGLAVLGGSRMLGSTTSWGDAPRSLVFLLAKLGFNLGTALYDLEFLRPELVVIALVPVALLILGAIAVWRSGDVRLRTFTLASLLVSTVPFVALDVVQHHHHFTETRYFVPAILALLIVAAAALSKHTRVDRRVTEVVASLALIVMALSSTIGSLRPIWWGNHQDATLLPIARVVAQDPRPLIWSWGIVGALETSLLLPDEARIALANPIDPAVVVREGLPAELLAPGPQTMDPLRKAGLRLVPLAASSLDTTTVSIFRHALGREKNRGIDLAEPTLWRIERLGASMHRENATDSELVQ
ncbi:MAG TPA: glycosyltransferase family 39 protein [Candidatus Baltobacteraceae bacterium]|jgi:uncharacterized membrane protein|nr:glycosyltransferase family 39 protein [Candidatus Baltobacteraceae bacterium]